MDKRSRCSSSTGKTKRKVLLSKVGEQGAQQACAGKSSGVGAWCAPRVICFCDRRKLSGVATEPRVAMRLSRQVSAASITEAARIKTGANSSPSRVAPGPILATLGIRSSLAPNLHFRRTCIKTPACVSRTFGFLCSHRSSGAQSHDHLPHHAHSTSPELMVAVPSTSRQETRRV